MDTEGESACIGVEFREDSRNGCRIGLVGHGNAILNECVWGRGEGGKTVRGSFWFLGFESLVKVQLNVQRVWTLTWLPRED